MECPNPNGRRDHDVGGRFQHRRCRCGFAVARYTSWTDDNPGRRFITCAEIGGIKCGFWAWIDPEMCERSRQIIPGLLRRLNELENRGNERNMGTEALRLLLRQSIAEVEELRARIDAYETAVVETTRSSRKYMILCFILFAVLVWVFYW